MTGAGQQRKPRGGPQATIDRVVDAAEAIIAAHGEHGLRIEEVAERSGVSVGSIYYHFEDREGLVKAVLHRQVVSMWGAELFAMFDPSPALEGAIDADDFADRYLSAMRHVHGDSLRAMRRTAAEMIGSSLSREELVPQLRDHVTRVLDELTRQCQPLEDRGFLRPGVSPRGFVLFIRSLSAGHIIVDLDTHPFDEQEWGRMVELSLRSMLTTTRREPDSA